ncbi:hypothetical protein [Pelobium manganitolerans]|uniref:hypothetical protein n=1 Tax=Pelobium manganitolerans TaxID=1842495 RepID=UPI003FA352B3
MATALNNKDQQQLIKLVNALREGNGNMGAYVEHFYDEQEAIVIKLSNGILKLSEADLVKFSQRAKPDKVLLKQLARSFSTSIQL